MDLLHHTEPQEAAASRVTVGIQSFLTRGALNADRDLRRHDLLAPPPPLTGGEHQSAESALTVSVGKNWRHDKEATFFSVGNHSNETNNTYEDEYAGLWALQQNHPFQTPWFLLSGVPVWEKVWERL